MDNFQVAIAGVKIAAKVLDIGDVNVEFLEKSYFPNPEINAVFLKENITVVFNKEWIINSTFLEIMVAAFHETRHAYQYFQITESELMKYQQKEETVRKWSIEFEKYIKPCTYSDLEIDYMNQDIEIDAIAFSCFLIKKLFEINTIVPKVIKDKVEYKITNLEKKSLL